MNSKKKIAEVEVILEDIMEELANDIVVSTDVIADYHIIDSLAKLVLDNQVKREDYTNRSNVRLIYLAEGAHNYTTSHNAYDVLVNNIGDIPPRYRGLLKSLNSLYKHMLPELNAYNDQMRNLINENHTDYARNYDWYYELPYHSSSGAIEYRIHDPKYKNKVRRIEWDGVRTHRKFICSYRIASIDSYKKIADLLNKTTDTLAFIPKKHILESFVGKYIDKDKIIIELMIKDDHLVMINTQDHSEKHIYSLSETEFFVLEGGMVRFEKNNSTDKEIMIYLNGYFSSSYTRHIGLEIDQ